MVSKLLNAEANGGPGDYGVDGRKFQHLHAQERYSLDDLLKVR